MVLARNRSQPSGRFFGIRALRLGDDLVLRNLVGQKIIVAHSPFRVVGIAAATESNYQRRQAFAIKSKRMVQTGSQHRRRTTIVFGRAKHGNGVRGARLIMGSVEMNLPVDPKKPAGYAK